MESSGLSMFVPLLILLIISVIVAGSIIFLVIYLNKSKNNNLIYEDEMGEQELKDLDDEIY